MFKKKKKKRVTRASVILLEQAVPFKPHARVCSGILGGLSIVTMAIYLRHDPHHPPPLLPCPYAVFFVFFYIKGFRRSHISLVPRLIQTRAEGATLSPEKVTAFRRGEAWERRGLPF